MDQSLQHQQMATAVIWWDVLLGHGTPSFQGTMPNGQSPGMGSCGCPSHSRPLARPNPFLGFYLWAGDAEPRDMM